jgi:hypothetical protein
MNYVLHLYAGTSSKPMQSIGIRNGVDPTSRGGIEFVDLNSDQYPDLKVVGGVVRGAKWYKVWHFEPLSEQFVWSQTTDGPGVTPN